MVSCGYSAFQILWSSLKLLSYRIVYVVVRVCCRPTRIVQLISG